MLSFCSLQFFVLQLAKLLFAELWLKALLFFYWSHAIKIFPTPLAVIWYSYQMSSSLLTNSSIINTHFFQFKGALSGLRQFLANESPLKMMKSDFYFIVKALFVLKILSFCLDFLVKYKNDLIRKTRLIRKFMTSQPG